jgi:hypothetical protein
VLILDMIEILPPLGKYKYNTQKILLVKCYTENCVCLRCCIRNINIEYQGEQVYRTPAHNALASRMLVDEITPIFPRITKRSTCMSSDAR